MSAMTATIVAAMTTVMSAMTSRIVTAVPTVVAAVTSVITLAEANAEPATIPAAVVTSMSVLSLSSLVRAKHCESGTNNCDHQNPVHDSGFRVPEGNVCRIVRNRETRFHIVRHCAHELFRGSAESAGLRNPVQNATQ